MSNTKTRRVQIKFEVPVEVRDKFQEIADKTGFSQALIFQMLVKYYLVSPLDVEHDVRRTLAAFAKKNEKVLRLSKRQKEVIADVTKFTDDLI